MTTSFHTDFVGPDGARHKGVESTHISAVVAATTADTIVESDVEISDKGTLDDRPQPTTEGSFHLRMVRGELEVTKRDGTVTSQDQAYFTKWKPGFDYAGAKSLAAHSFKVGERYRPTPAECAMLGLADASPGTLELFVVRIEADMIRFDLSFDYPLDGGASIHVSGSQTRSEQTSDSAYSGTFMLGGNSIGTLQGEAHAHFRRVKR